ncbi:MAG TPA: fatty acid desaturase [Verrucomicrobiae bacterium]|nr:fatty acid desaturase [Verrucomicrobiae bacterium]
MQSSPHPSVAKRGKYRHIALCFLPQMVCVLVAVGILEKGYWLLLPILFLQVVVPLLDLITGWQDGAHFDKSDFSPVEESLLFWNVRLYALFYMTTVVYFAMSIRQVSGVEGGLVLAASSLMGGVCFAAAHELLHAKTSLDQILQRITTAFLFYPHYKLIHIRSHHVHAGTDEDENTAWFNESFYSYLYRTIPGSAIRSWHLEAKRVFNGKRSAEANLIRNKMISYALGQLALLLVFYLLSGVWGLLFYVAQVIGAHIVLESVNYIQHYGLLRKRQDGEYEKTGPEHAWDTYHLFSSYVTFRVGHHSYHHLAVKPYYLLVAEPQAPKLPVGYFWSIPMVLLPPWWRRVINPRLTASAARVDAPT